MPRFLFAFTLVLTLVWASAPASSHAVLLDADPSDGTVLMSAPARVTLTFNEPVTPVIVRLIGGDGQPVELAGEASDQTVTIDLPSDLQEGGYVLSYRVTSLDSHPIGGSLTFAVGAGHVAIRSEARDVAHWDLAYAALRWVTMVALFLAVGAPLFSTLAPKAAIRDLAPTAARLARMAGPMAAVAALLSVGARGAQLADSPLGEIWTATPWRIGLSTTVVAELLLVLAGSALASLWPGRKVFVATSVLLAAVGLGMTSHAALADPLVLSFAAYVVHTGVAAFWLGSLPLLAIAIARAPLASAQNIVARFSTLAVWAVAGLLVAGALLTLVQTGSDLSMWTGPAWTESAYGPLLAAKLTLASAVLMFAVRNKLSLTPRLMDNRPDAPRGLRRSMAWEAAAMTAVIASAAALGTTVPPRSLAALGAVHAHHTTAVEGAVVEAVRDGVEILLEADPAVPGPNDLVVHFFDETKGEHLLPIEVTVAAALPSKGVEPLRRAATAQGDGTYRIEGMPLAISGVWEIRIEALVSDFDKLIVSLELPIGVEQK